jgi:hypothetical protein
MAVWLLPPELRSSPGQPAEASFWCWTSLSFRYCGSNCSSCSGGWQTPWCEHPVINCVDGCSCPSQCQTDYGCQIWVQYWCCCLSGFLCGPCNSGWYDVPYGCNCQFGSWC